MKILYLLDSTALCGGVKVVFCQAQALGRLGHDVSVICGEEYPDWFDGYVNYICGDIFDNTILKRFDHIVATSPLHVLHLCNGRKVDSVVPGFLASQDKNRNASVNQCDRKFCDVPYNLWHLVQGYEGELDEACHLKDRIIQGYRLPIRRITVSHRLCMKLEELFPGMWCRSVGQGIEHDIFYPDKKALDNIRTSQVKSLIISGPFTMPVKNIEKALFAFTLVKKKHPHIELIRISSVDTKDAEEKITGRIKQYHVRLTPGRVADVLRASNGILLSVSLPAEGFGLPGIEAMACAVPVVLSDIPAYRCYNLSQQNVQGTESGNIGESDISGGNGDTDHGDTDQEKSYERCGYAAFVAENTPEAMAYAVNDLIGNDKKRLHHIKKGLSVAATFSFEKVACRLESVFQESDST